MNTLDELRAAAAPAAVVPITNPARLLPFDTGKIRIRYKSPNTLGAHVGQSYHLALLDDTDAGPHRVKYVRLYDDGSMEEIPL